MASSEVYEVVLSGGAPWGFRLQGGKEFRAPLRIAKVCPFVWGSRMKRHVCILFEFHSDLVVFTAITIFRRRNSIS